MLYTVIPPGIVLLSRFHAPVLFYLVLPVIVPVVMGGGTLNPPHFRVDGDVLGDAPPSDSVVVDLQSLGQ